ncbi:unnamed protein product [Oikopleura dioica]|uniref:Uncharacterized protein n=1 Tax=Oikopleura dioica TaxID=34765 RepID=E4Y621_OIKDI|nr:unnamed protein product [Oikopleura dioica]
MKFHLRETFGLETVLESTMLKRHRPKEAITMMVMELNLDQIRKLIRCPTLLNQIPTTKSTSPRFLAPPESSRTRTKVPKSA